MPDSRKRNTELVEENVRLRAQVAQLEDRLDHLSEHSASAAAVHASESLSRDVMSVVSDAVLLADDAGRLTYASPNVHFIFGHSDAEVLQQGRIGFLLPSGLFDPDLLEQRGEVANIECQVRDAIGRAHDLLVTVRRISRHGGTVMYICRDVTERKKLQLDYELLSLTLERRVEERTQALRDSRERYRRLVEGLRDEYFFYATDAQGVVTYVSPSVHTILGYGPDQVIGRNWREFADANHASLARLEELERQRFAGLPTPMFTAPIWHADGSIRMLEFRDCPLADADGRVIANEGIAKDVTQRHAAEEELRRAHEELERRVEERTAELTAMYERLRDSEHRYRSVVEDHLDFIVRWRDEGVRTFVNDSYCRYWGSPREQLIGTSFLPGIVEQDLDSLKEKLAAVSVDDPVVVHEHRVVLPDGRVAWHRWSHRALFSPQGKLVEFQSVGSDVTDRRRREEHTRERAMAVGQLRQLSIRELDVMRLVVAGDANKVIARKLNLSVKTVEKHRSSLMRKLQIRSVPELVRLALLADAEVDS